MVLTDEYLVLTEDVRLTSAESTHLFVLVDQDVKRAQFEYQQTPEQLHVTLAFIGFPRVIEVDKDFIIKLRICNVFGLTDDFDRRSFHHSAPIHLLLLLRLSTFGGCDC